MKCYLEDRTVREIVREITRYSGLLGWKYPDEFISAASENILHLIKSGELRAWK